VLLYEILARRPPFEAATFMELSSKVLNDAPLPPSRFNPRAAPDLERICLTCLRKAPEERYASAADLADDLARVARGARVARRLDPPSRMGRLVRRHRRAAVAVLVALLVTGVALTASRSESPASASPLVEMISEPAGASVYIGDHRHGTTPVAVPPQDRVLLSLAGFTDAEVAARGGPVRVKLVRPGEVPLGMVYVAPAGLFVDRTEVTVAEYARFVRATGHKTPPTWKRGLPPRGEEQLPITGVSWQDGQAFATWAEKRLPTEEEWSAAAWGVAGPLVCAPREGPQAVGGPLSDRSIAGCVDLLGNVQEWTASAGTAGADYRVVRGGRGFARLGR
jgi:formylglycine-generating enzyme required for sulfatase activity